MCIKALAAQFDETKLNAAKAAVKDIEDTKIPAVNDAVKNFMAKAVDPSDPAYITEANDVNDQVDTLVKDLKVPTDKIEQYKEFKERYTPLEEQSQKIKAVENKIDEAVKGITEDTVKFSDKNALDDAQAALDSLVIEIFGQVYGYGVSVSFFRIFLDFPNRLLGTPFRTVTVAAV